MYEFIPQENLIPEFGGEAEHDTAAWVEAQIARENTDFFGSLSDCEGHHVRLSDEYEVNLDEFAD